MELSPEPTLRILSPLAGDSQREGEVRKPRKSGNAKSNPNAARKIPATEPPKESPAADSMLQDATHQKRRRAPSWIWYGVPLRFTWPKFSFTRYSYCCVSWSKPVTFSSV